MLQNVQSRLTNSAKAVYNFIPVTVWDNNNNRNMTLFTEEDEIKFVTKQWKNCCNVKG